MADYLGKKIKFNIEDNDLQKIRFNKAYGESQQATRSGKNLFDSSQIVNVSDYIVANGTGIKIIKTTNERISPLYNISLKANTEYTISCNLTSTTTYPTMYCQWRTNDGSTLWVPNLSNGSTTFTPSKDIVGVIFYLQTTDTDGTYVELTNLQIEKGSTATDYEPYGASPSPDYRSEIENLEGKNLVQQMNWKQVPSITTGATVTTVNGYGTDFIEVDNTKNYIFSYSGTASSKYVAYYDESKNFLGHGINLQIDSYANWNVTKYVRLRIDCSENAVTNLQLEAGTVATPYVPYNSLEFKDEGKNKFDCANSRIIYNNSNAASYERLENGLKLISGGSQYSMIYFLVDTVKNLKDKTLTLSSDISFSKDNQLTTFGLFYTDINGGNRTTLVNNNNVTSEGKYQVTGQVEEGENRDYVCIGLRPNMASNYASGDYTIYDNLQVEIGETATDYEPYKSQTAYFPLSEGQKLMKGSYLADDGIHHSRKQVVFDGSDDENWTQNGPNQGYGIVIDNVGGNAVDNVTSSVLCDKLTAVPQNTIYKGSAINGVASIGGTMHKLYVRFDSSITTVALLREKLAESPILIEYELAEEEIVPYTETQQEAREKLRHFKGLNGENNITAQGTMTSTLDLTLYNVAEEDFDIYISKKGYFVALKYDINNLIDFMESNIPSIAEATESSVKIAGRDGDISLNTVYEPLPFEIVCYTEDNLTPEEKIIEEQKITSLLNSIKNQTKTFFMEREKKFYKVKYSGNLSVVRYPKHLKFTIPLKSSESYAMNFEESEIIGNGTKVSNTIKDTGAIFTIKGPATKPIISLNNYQMKYNENILEGNSLIINSEDSTITHITSAGVKTNAMRAYNHEFPKIKNGENQLAVSSGIDDEKQVNVKWYDLKI